MYIKILQQTLNNTTQKADTFGEKYELNFEKSLYKFIAESASYGKSSIF